MFTELGLWDTVLRNTMEFKSSRHLSFAEKQASEAIRGLYSDNGIRMMIMRPLTESNRCFENEADSISVGIDERRVMSGKP
jgi:hypothetical protein